MKLIVALLAILALLVAAGCGGDDEDMAEQPPAQTAREPISGEAIFKDNCGSCHMLEAAGTSGSVGPNLDDVQPAEARVEEQVRNGGGAMPAFEGELSDDEIRAVAEYVAGAAGG